MSDLLSERIAEVFEALQEAEIPLPDEKEFKEKAKVQCADDLNKNNSIYRYKGGGSSQSCRISYFDDGYNLIVCAMDFRQQNGKYRVVYSYKAGDKHGKKGEEAAKAVGRNVSSILDNYSEKDRAKYQETIGRSKRLVAVCKTSLPIQLPNGEMYSPEPRFKVVPTIEASKDFAEQDKSEKEKEATLQDGLKKYCSLTTQDVTCPYLVGKKLNKLVGEYGLYYDIKSGVLIAPLTKTEAYKPYRVTTNVLGNQTIDHSSMRSFAAILGWGTDNKRNFGDSANSLFIHGCLKTCGHIIIAEGVATGLAALEVFNDYKREYRQGDTSTTALIALCASPTTPDDYKFEALKKALKVNKVKRSRVPIFVIADNDWDNGVFNKGMVSANNIVEALSTEYKAYLVDVVEHTRNQRYPDGTAKTDFCDFRADLIDEDEEARDALSSKFDIHLLKHPEQQYIFPFSTNLKQTNISKYHARSIENKIDMTHFPQCLREFIDIRMGGLWDETVASYVIAQIACDMGLVGSQLFTRKMSGSVDYASMFLIIVAPTASGKSECIKNAMLLTESCSDWIDDKKRDLVSQLLNKQLALEAIDDQLKLKSYEPKKDDNSKGSFADGSKSALGDNTKTKYELAAEKFQIKEEMETMRGVLNIIECLDPLYDSYTKAKVTANQRISRNALVVSDEYSQFLQEQSRETHGDQAAVSAMVITQTDSGRKSAKIKGEISQIARNATMTIVSSTTSANLHMNFDDQQIGSGFLSRVMFSYFDRKTREIKTNKLKNPPRISNEDLPCETELGRKLTSLWHSVVDDIVGKYNSSRVTDCARDGVQFIVDDELYLQEKNAFEKYLDLQCDELTAIGGDKPSFILRAIRTFDKLASYFAMLSIPEYEDDEVEDQDLLGDKGKKYTYDKLVYTVEQDVNVKWSLEEYQQDKEYRPRKSPFKEVMIDAPRMVDNYYKFQRSKGAMLDRDAKRVMNDMINKRRPKVIVSAKNAKAAASVIAHILESALKTYPFILTPVKQVKNFTGVRPSQELAIKSMLLDFLRNQYHMGVSTSFSIDNIRKSTAFKRLGIETCDMRTAFRQLVEEQELVLAEDTNRVYKRGDNIKYKLI